MFIFDLLTMSAFFFALGLFFGSFFHVVIDRLPRGETIFRGNSHCDLCGHNLAWYDLIPVVSYLLLSGKCRYCNKRFGSLHPFVEVTTGIVFVSTFIYWQMLELPVSFLSPIVLLFYLFVASTFIIIFFTDLKYGLIPFAVVAPGAITTLLFLLVTNPSGILSHLLSGIISCLFFLLLHVITKGRGMGFGDVVLVFYLGLIIGFPNIAIAVYLAFLTGALVSLILILRRKKKLRGSIIPFGPFLIFGAFVSMYMGTTIKAYVFAYLGL